MKEKLKKVFAGTIIVTLLCGGLYVLFLVLADFWPESGPDKEWRNIKSFCDGLFNPDDSRYDKCFDRAGETFYPDPPVN